MREMKDSGVEWIGEIPQEWELTQVKYLFKIGRGRVIAQTELTDTGVYPVFSSQTKDNGCLGYIDTYDFDLEQLTWTTDGANAGTVFIRSGKHNCTNVCGTLQPLNNRQNLKYQKYALEHIAFYHKRADTNGFKIMNNEMAAIHTICPPLSTQKKIASYLDRKCSKIDEIIAKQGQVIEKLKAYKLSVITEAVTKGLNPDVKMKDSGVEWIGEINNNYSVVLLKYLLSKNMQYGANETGIEYDETLPRYIRITDITSGGELKNDGKQSLAKEVAEPYILSDGDILFARSGGTVGKTFLYKKEYGTGAFAGYLIRAQVNPKKCLYRFVYYYTCSGLYEIWKNGSFIQATIQNIGADKYSNMPVVVPSITEQQKIASYLDRKCTQIESAIEKKQAIIDKLTAYKKSLIYEVVTGKKEV